MNDNTTRCDGVTRRDALKLGLLTGFGLTLTDLLRLQSASADTPSPNTRTPVTNHQSPTTNLSCILLWLDGGPSHLDTFDPKPDAPAEIRGDFKAISTNVDGIQICEHLLRTAQVMNHVALIRSLTHELGNHDTGSHFLLTGHRPTPVLEYPGLGSIVAKETGLGRSLPPYIAIPEPVAAAKAGYLSAAYDPYAVGPDPSCVRDLQRPEGVWFDRIERRRDFVKRLDDFSRHVEENATTRSRDSFYEQAYRLLTSPEAKAAFDLSKEPAVLRERYGHSRIGTSCLLARRLVEAGARFVTVTDTGWDTHNQIFKALPDALFPGSGKLPALDRAYAALLTDLHQRGMLATTLVVMMGEFGRTPKINALGGRDHWPRAGFACLAGGGVRGGQVIGATDAHGESPAERPIRPEDLTFSLLTLLGVNPHKEYQTSDGRPIKILSEGDMIAGLR
jgi:hypothetical protein